MKASCIKMFALSMLFLAMSLLLCQPALAIDYTGSWKGKLIDGKKSWPVYVKLTQRGAKLYGNMAIKRIAGCGGTVYVDCFEGFIDSKKRMNLGGFIHCNCNYSIALKGRLSGNKITGFWGVIDLDEGMELIYDGKFTLSK